MRGSLECSSHHDKSATTNLCLRVWDKITNNFKLDAQRAGTAEEWVRVNELSFFSECEKVGVSYMRVYETDT